MKARLTKRFGTDDLAPAAAILRAGGLVAFPTETVYGLGASALDPKAVARIFHAKQRPAWDPLIVHVSDRPMLDRIAVTSAEATRLIDAFWPGPLTLLLPRTNAVPDAVTAGRSLVGVRMPSHPVALALIRLAALPLAAPSANTFGHTSPTTAAHVLGDLDGRIDAVVDAGPTTVGVESTVLDLAERTIYRPGAITPGMIEAILGVPVTLHRAELTTEPTVEPQSLPSPGVGIRHYAPRARLILVDDQDQMLAAMRATDARVGVMLPDGWHATPTSHQFSWAPWNDPEALARTLFAGLRQLDDAGVEVIICPLPPTQGIGEALRDRLRKAARPR